jgi:hypothetical protein
MRQVASHMSTQHFFPYHEFETEAQYPAAKTTESRQENRIILSSPQHHTRPVLYKLCAEKKGISSILYLAIQHQFMHAL